jgi:acetylornithine/LysW-gamma-L-lysine aminotransferase
MSPGFVFSEKPIRIDRGTGTTLYDEEGRAYLDAGASYACVPAGHCHPDVVGAVQRQAERLFYVQGSYQSEPRTRLYDRLSSLAPGDIDRVWLCNSGTEANEAAIKFARHATGRSKIIATKQAFHGRTMGALAATWNSAYKDGFEPLPGSFEFVTYGDTEALKAAVDEKTAAVILEPIQGEGGVNPAPDGYLETVRDVTSSAGAAMILDEIQTGLGRTGSFWAVSDSGVTPDILTTAKGLANGLPMAATLCREWIAADHGDHGSTFSGGPLVSASANATLEVIESERLPAHAEEVGRYLRTTLEEALGDEVRAVRGQGLMIGIEVRRGSNRVLRSLALDQQILALPAGRTVVRLLPPLVLDRGEADQLVAGLTEVLIGEDAA